MISSEKLFEELSRVKELNALLKTFDLPYRASVVYYVGTRTSRPIMMGSSPYVIYEVKEGFRYDHFSSYAIFRDLEKGILKLINDCQEERYDV